MDTKLVMTYMLQEQMMLQEPSTPVGRTHFNNIIHFSTLLVVKVISRIRELCSGKKASKKNSNVGLLTTPANPENIGSKDATENNGEGSSTSAAGSSEQSSLADEPSLADETPVATVAQGAAAAIVETASPAAASLDGANPESSPAGALAAELIADATVHTKSEETITAVEAPPPAPLSPRAEALAVDLIAVASESPIVAAAESAASPLPVPKESTVPTLALPIQELERIKLVLNAFNEQKNIDALVKNSTEKTKLALKKVQDGLQAASETYERSLKELSSTLSRDLTAAEMSTAQSAFKKECEFHVTNALANGLADDLSWMAYLLNMLKELCNVIIAKVSGNSNQFFALAKSPLEQNVDDYVGRLGA